MTPSLYERADKILELMRTTPAEGRAAVLERECGSDAGLRAEVESLVKNGALDGVASATGSQASDDDWATAGATPMPERVGMYRLLRPIGQGGMGAVYEAVQEMSGQAAAVKLVRPGLASAEMLRRFEFELQVLARLEHAGVARIYHADTVDFGSGRQPYFVMELVRGQNLIDYANGRQLSLRRRLELAALVADAVQYAHQQGVIHRDLKPGNILVTDEGQPKILDFGVARLADEAGSAWAKETKLGQLIGTLPYMSPEQAAGDPAQIDTRSDVYALGVVIYELLTGRLPYLLLDKGLPEIVRIIREEEPTRLSSLNKSLGGDVETIVGKALEKDKTRRYQTANALAADIRRSLGDEPISARPPSAMYQLNKFARRHKSIVGGMAAVMILLTASIIVTSVLLARARAAETLANIERGKAVVEAARAGRAEKAAEKAAREKIRADELKQVSDFQAEMLSQIDTNRAGADLMKDVRKRFGASLKNAGVPKAERAAQAKTLRDLLVRVNATDTAAAMIDRTILRPAVEGINKLSTDQPVVAAKLQQALADVYRTIGLYDAALPLQQSALATRRRVLGEEHPDTLSSVNKMGTLLQAQGKLAEAEPYLREALDKNRRVLGEEPADMLNSISNMGALLQAQGKLVEAEPYYREALEKSRRMLGEDHPHTLSFISNMGGLLMAQGKLREAEPYHLEALEMRRRQLGEEHPDTLASISDMGILLQAEGKLAEAEPYYREALEKRRRVLGEEHPDTIRSISKMSFMLHTEGKLAEAEPYFRQALEKCRRVLGEEHPDTLTALNNMGGLLQAQGRLPEAERYYRETLEKRRRVLGEEHPNTLAYINNMGALLQNQGKLSEAEPYLREALEKRRSVLGAAHPYTLSSISNVGTLLQDQGKLPEAEAYYREALEKRRRVLGEEHPDTLTSIVLMGGVHEARGKLSEAEPYYREALEKRRRVQGEEHPHTLTAINNMGGLLMAQGKLAEAQPYCREALEKRRRVLGEDHPNTLTSIGNMGALLTAQGKLTEAEPYYRQALEKRRRVLGEEHPDTLDSITNMGSLMRLQGKQQEAIDLLAVAEPAARKALTGGNVRRLAGFLTTLGQCRVELGFDAERFKLAEANLLEAHSIYVKARGEKHADTIACVQGLVNLYTAWDKAEPDKGYDVKGTKWRAVLSELQASTRPSAPSTAPASAAQDNAPNAP